MMHRIHALALAAAIIGAATQASATALESCCACIPVPPPSGTIAAAFCAEVDSANSAEMHDRCAAVPGHDLACVLNIPGPTCFDQLADEGYACPTAGVPAASPYGLVAGLLLLSAIGAVALRRR